MTTALSSISRDFRSPTVVAVAVCHLVNSTASIWSTLVCKLLPKADCSSGGRSWSLTVSTLVSGEAFHVSCGPQLVIDFEVCPGCVSSLSLAVSEGNMLAVNRRWPAMSCSREERDSEGLDHANCYIKPRVALLDNCHLYRSLKFIEKEGHISIFQQNRLAADQAEMSCKLKFPLSRIVKRNLIVQIFDPDHIYPLPRPVVLLDSHYCGFVLVATS